MSLLQPIVYDFEEVCNRNDYTTCEECGCELNKEYAERIEIGDRVFEVCQYCAKDLEDI